MPNLRTDGSAFFPNVLKTKEFQKEGILFGDEAAPETPNGEMGQRLMWAVIDPRKHTLYIWEKKDAEFPTSAVKLGASVFTNGPFCLYSGMKKWWFAYPSYWWNRLKGRWGLAPLSPNDPILQSVGIGSALEALSGYEGQNSPGLQKCTAC